jgi:hypothetical protein
MGPRAGLDAVSKRKIPIPRRKSNPRTPIVRPIASAIPIELSRLVPRSIVHGAVPPLPQYAFMAWCSVKAQTCALSYKIITAFSDNVTKCCDDLC